MEKIKAITELFTLVFIHLILPIAGIVAYIRLLRKMRREQVSDIPKISLFMLFFIYGSVLTVILTGLFWKWSGMSSLGLAFLTFVAPIIFSIIAWQQRNHTGISSYHLILYRMALVYLVGEAVLVVAGVVIQL